MPAATRQTPNLLIRSLSDADFGLLETALERVPLHKEDVISPLGSRVDSVCFPESGIASYASIGLGGERTGIGIIGFEGLVGAHVLLGCDVSPHEVTATYGGGVALRCSTDHLLSACGQSETLRSVLNLFVQSFIIQLTHTAVSNLNDSVERRLSRWLLMNHDRLAGDEIELTHAEIGVMLGVRRASVTDALHLLEGEGLIRSSRRLITICNRSGLRRAAGENYGKAEAEYVRLIAPFGKDG
ncbi:Crp/Fnr family transcriptional regulator [Sphingomonas sp.]|jgi:CRP-like cAMP-binding protein|uniref:Crp/Fnr family transcriptional regulator n=1 Tax=Sphingomonas sp. TaxID=28214 RepID=UPI002DE97087|nr:Crp/Fnr family transcriptional regulator [Sphingomonas sp.]